MFLYPTTNWTIKLQIVDSRLTKAERTSALYNKAYDEYDNGINSDATCRIVLQYAFPMSALITP